MKERYVGAVDIGGTKILTGIVDSQGKVWGERSFPTATGPGSAEACAQLAAGSLRSLTVDLSIPFQELGGIGIACTGPVDTLSGTVENPYTLPGWEGFPLTEKLRRLTGLKVVLENDVNGALLGEVMLRGLQQRRVLMIAFGTGIGVAVCDRGALYEAGRFHPEMGHVIVDRDGPECYCHHRGCFESLWSGASLNQRAAQAGHKDFDHLFAQYEQDDSQATAFMDQARHQLQNGVWNLMSIFKAELIILGGGLMKRYFKFAKEAIEADLGSLEDFTGKFEILPAGVMGDPALVGAARLIFETE